MALSIKESFIAGFTDFFSRKIRSLVTILGIVLGTMSIIVILSLVNGINKQSLAWMMERGGLTKITVRENWDYKSPTNQKDYFQLKEINFIRSKLPEAKHMNPRIRHWVKFAFEDKEYHTSVNGVMPAYTEIEEWFPQEGRFFNMFDYKNSNNVIVIGTTVKEELFGNRNPIGEYITVQNKRLQVIGVMKHRYMKNKGQVGRENVFSYLNRRTFVPLSTLIHKGTGEDRISRFTIKAKDLKSVSSLKRKLEALLLNMRAGEPIFRVWSAKERAEEIKKNSRIFAIIFYIISMISLFVGGIVIMNIMLASIKERTREIGIRIAVGAKRIDIFIQFLVQSVLVTSIGGIIGVSIGLSILDVVEKYLEFELIPSFVIILIAIVISAGVGLIFGIFPSIKASNLNPVEALRYE